MRISSYVSLLGSTLIALTLTLALFVGTTAAQQVPKLSSPQSLGQSTPTDPSAANPAPPAEQTTVSQDKDGSQKQHKAYLTYKTPYEIWLTGLTIVLVVVLSILLCIMAWAGTLTHEFYKAFLILVVVFSALFLIVAGYTDQQTAPVFSLLGTIAGYIFGRSVTDANAPPDTAGPTTKDAGSNGTTADDETKKESGSAPAPPKAS